MKSLSQTIRYTSQCSFTDDDWGRVLEYCKIHFKGGKIHRAIRPISESTYDKFLNWITDGIGSGDIMGYGVTCGIIGISVPGLTTFEAYLDYEGKLIIKQMIIREPQRLYPVEEERKIAFKKLVFDVGLYYSVRTNAFSKLYTPEKYSYIIIYNDYDNVGKVGMYLESTDKQIHFASLLDGNKLKMDCWIDSECTPLRPADNKDIQRLTKATSKHGWSFNARTNTYIKVEKRAHDNVYWYINDRFAVVQDKDNGSEKHEARFKAGNYFIDRTEAVTFMRRIKELKMGKS